jgi:hypothetical protein
VDFYQGQTINRLDVALASYIGYPTVQLNTVPGTQWVTPATIRFE